jgi:hypothetical protein
MNAGVMFPLPKGEGWGEGEGTVRQPAAHESPRLAQNSTAHGKDSLPRLLLDFPRIDGRKQAMIGYGLISLPKP